MIEGLKGTEPIGAVVTVGTKGPKGNPVDRDRFYIKMPQMDDSGGRPEHAKFAVFNTAPPERRRTLMGNLVHASIGDAFHYQLTAQKLPGLTATPSQQPHCTGDGCKAMRWDGKEFREIRCPNEICEYRVGDVKLCKPFARLYFRLRWEETAGGKTLPSIYVKLTTQSWNSVRAMVGFFDSINDTARSFGLDSANLFGLPFTVTLAEKSQPAKKKKFPVLSFSVDGDLIAFLMAQRQRMEQIAASPVYIGASDPSETRLIGTDIIAHAPGKPEAFRPRTIDLESEDE